MVDKDRVVERWDIRSALIFDDEMNSNEELSAGVE